MNKPNLLIQIITPDGDTYDLHNPPDRVISQLTGLGLSNRDISTVRGPYQHGQTVLSQKLSPRTVLMTLRHNGCSKDQHWNHRGTYIDLLRENRSELFSPEPHQLKLTYIEDGTYKSRALDVFLTGGFSFNPPPEAVWDQWAISEEIEFTAYNPVIYDPTQKTAAITFDTEELVLPMTFSFILGSYSGSANITYTGTWEEYPTVRINGPAAHVSIINTSTNKRLNYNGAISGGDYVDFNLTYDNKTVTNSCGESVAQYASGDIGTFSLQPDPLVTGGINAISIYAEEIPASSGVTFYYYDRYRGI